MIGVDYSGIADSVLVLGVANATDSMLYVNMVRAVVVYEYWLLILTAVFMGWFLYTRNAIVAIIASVVLAVNMYVFNLTDYDDMTKLIVRCVLMLLIAVVWLVLLSGRKGEYAN